MTKSSREQDKTQQEPGKPNYTIRESYNSCDKHYYKEGLPFHILDLFDEAMQEYREALKIKPELALAYYNWGLAFKDAGDFDKALEAYHNFIKYTQPKKYAQLVEEAHQHIKEIKGGGKV